MPVILNISERRPLPEVEVEALRDIARHNPTETLIVGQRRMTLHYIQFMDRFSVEPLPGTLFERLGDGRHRRLAENLETQHRAELTLMHSPLIQGTFPAVNST